MIASNYTLDKSAIGLSGLCAIHCLLLPVFLQFFPVVFLSKLGDESIHQLLLVFVVPVSAIALFVGCKKHKQSKALVTAGFGIALMILALTHGHDLFGEYGEKALTLVGAALVALSHWLNFSLCKNADCDCSSR